MVDPNTNITLRTPSTESLNSNVTLTDSPKSKAGSGIENRILPVRFVIMTLNFETNLMVYFWISNTIKHTPLVEI